jgi:hypothetical protein
LAVILISIIPIAAKDIGRSIASGRTEFNILVNGKDKFVVIDIYKDSFIVAPYVKDGFVAKYKFIPILNNPFTFEYISSKTPLKEIVVK